MSPFLSGSRGRAPCRAARAAAPHHARTAPTDHAAAAAASPTNTTNTSQATVRRQNGGRSEAEEGLERVKSTDGGAGKARVRMVDVEDEQREDGRRVLCKRGPGVIPFLLRVRVSVMARRG